MTELPALEQQLLAAAKRRSRRPPWRRRRLTGVPALRVALPALTVIAIVSAALIGASRLSGRNPSDERAATPTPAWTTTTNRARGFTVSLPAGWQLARHSLTPHLLDPRELFSAATFPLVDRPATCSQFPTGALHGIGRAGAFVSVQERGRAPGADWSEFKPRPARFADHSVPAINSDIATCLAAQHHLHVFWMPFSDGSRHFYAMVVFGPDVPAARRSQAFAILDRVSFDPSVQPTWDASG